MRGKSLNEFLDELYYNPEMEIVYDGKRYMISGYVAENGYVLEMFEIDSNTMMFEISSVSRNECVTAFENAAILNGHTIYQVEKDIEVVYG